MLLVLTEEHKEHLSFLTEVDVEGKLDGVFLFFSSKQFLVCLQW